MGLERLAKNALFGLKYASRTDENLYLWFLAAAVASTRFGQVCVSRCAFVSFYVM